MNRSKLAGILTICTLASAGVSIARAQGGGPPLSAQDGDHGEPAISGFSPRISVTGDPQASADAAPLPVIPVQPLRPEKDDEGSDEGVDAAIEEADEEMLARALERSLVLSGGVLLPPGQYELEPGLRYDYYRRRGLAIVPGGIAERDLTQETVVAGLDLRTALPWAAQLNLSVPYVRRRVENIAAGTGTSVDDSGLGDIEIGVSRQVFSEGASRPAVIAALAYQRAADAADSSAFGVGYDAWSVSLTALKRTDPLVLVGSLTYAFNRPARSDGVEIDPDDTSSADVRAILAASPGVSVRAGFSLSRSGDIRFENQGVAGTRQTIAVLELGGSIVVSSRVLFDLSIGAGLTDDAPDFVLGVSLPIRAVLPWLTAARGGAG